MKMARSGRRNFSIVKLVVATLLVTRSSVILC